MKIVFMGTPEYSVPTLNALIHSEHEVVAVYTKPDKPKGRGKKLEITPVKALAEQHQIPVYQPQTFKNEEAIQELKQIDADVAVVIAYGLLLPLQVLQAFPKGCINLHASLLPKFRGASPIQAAILAGESKTGVTSMQMDVGLDTGDMLEKVEIALDGSETADRLHDILADLSAQLCLSTLSKAENGTLVATPQGEEEVSYAGKICKEMGEVDWLENADVIDRKIRALTSWPSAYTSWQGKRLKICLAQPIEQVSSGEFGKVLRADRGGIDVSCGDGSIRILQLQLEGKKQLSAGDFLNGQKLEVGQFLGKSE